MRQGAVPGVGFSADFDFLGRDFNNDLVRTSETLIRIWNVGLQLTEVMMKQVDFEKIYPWFLLNFEARPIVERIVSEWDELLNDTNNNEAVYHQFLAEYAGFFFSDGDYRIPVVSKLRLGADYETDFVVVTDKASYGFEYEFIEIETPHTVPYTSKGDPSALLTHSMQQVRNWRTWLEANRSEAKKLFPSKLFTMYDTPNFAFSVYIGRWSTSESFFAFRNRLAAESNIWVHTFDHLTYFLKNRTFGLYPAIVWPDWKQVDSHTLNRLANPFFKAYSDRKWRKIVGSYNLNLTHMIAKNAELLLKHREYNNLFREFIAIWNGLSYDKRNDYITKMEQLTKYRT